jgi:hypothetical protein
LQLKGVVTGFALLAFLLAAQERAPDLCQISGSVVNSITGEALNRVELFAEPAGGDGAPASTVTDAKGNFTLLDLKAGQYRLSGRRNGFLYMYYGARRPGNKGTTITLVPGQQLTGLQFKLIPFAVIAGTVRETDGEPISGAKVILLRVKYRAEGPDLERAGEAQTDDLGQYRIPDLVGGKYYVRAVPGIGRDSNEEKAEDHGPKDLPREILAGAIYGGAPDLAS